MLQNVSLLGGDILTELFDQLVENTSKFEQKSRKLSTCLNPSQRTYIIILHASSSQWF